MHQPFFAFAFTVVVSAFAFAGCDTSTTGSSGVVSFEYQSSQCSLFGCGLDKPALQNARVTIQATGGDPNLRPTAKFATGAVGTVASQSEACSCQTGSDTNTSRAIDPTEPCNANETKSCQLLVNIDTTTPGDDILEIHEPNGALRDSVDFHVRAASRIAITVTSGQNQDVTPVNGVYTVHVGDDVQLNSTVFDSAGDQLVFSESGLAFAYANAGVLGPTPNVIGGATDTEYMTAFAAGAASVTDSTNGATATVTAQFQVTP